MAKKRTTTYTFTAASKTVQSADFTSLEVVLLIVNVTDNIIIYNFADPSVGATHSGTTLTLEYDTTSMSDSRKRLIFVDDGTTPLTRTATGDTAHDAVDAGNPLKIGGYAGTALPSSVANADRVNALFDKFGRQVVVNGTIRDLVGTQTTTISSSTAETTIVTAAASVFNDLTAIVISNTSSTGARVDFRDTTAGSVLFSLYIPPVDVRGVAFQRPLPQTTVNTNWTAQSSASVADLRVLAVFDKNR